MTELQGWIIIALLLVLVVGHIAIGLHHMRFHWNQDDPAFGQMWERNEIDPLIEHARRVLATRPNHQSALYFGGKALHSRGRLAEAQEYFERLIKSEPSLRRDLQRELEDIEQGRVK